MKYNFRLFTIIVIVLMGCFLAWYLFLKSWDYKIYFTVKAQPAVVYQSIYNWNEWGGKTLQTEKFNILNKNPWSHLETQKVLDDTTLVFNWDIQQKNDSATRVKVGISDNKRKIYNRIRVPFFKTTFKESTTKNTLLLKNKIESLSKNFRYNFVGTDSFDEIPCVYISAKNTARGKAYEMMNTVLQLNQFVKANKLVLSGDPLVQINDWEPLSDTIQFDFCFPVLHPELMPEDSHIKLKTVKMPKAIKGEFYGNYSISDMAWYELFEEAKRTDKNISGQIIEVFYNDPHSGENDLDWKAGIYFGINE